MAADIVNSNVLRVLAYLVAAVLCLGAGGRARDGGGSQRTFWLTLAGAMALLALARNLDFGPEITSAGRDFAKAHGWYPERREYQRAVDILLATGCCALSLSILAFRPWRERARILASCLFLALLAYVAIRAVSYHNVDQLLYSRSINGVRINAIIELALICAMGATTVRWPTGPARREAAISRQPTNT